MDAHILKNYFPNFDDKLIFYYYYKNQPLFARCERVVAVFVHVIVELAHHGQNVGLGVFVVVRDGDVACESAIIVVDGRHGCALFGGEFVDFSGGNLVVQLIDDLHRELCVIDFNTSLLTDALDSAQNLVERHDLGFAVSFYNKHFGCHSVIIIINYNLLLF